MALEAVVYPPDRFTYGFKDLFPYDFCFKDLESNLELQEEINHQYLHANWDSSSTSVMQSQQQHAKELWDSSSTSVMQPQQQHAKELWDPYTSSPEACTVDQSLNAPAACFQAQMEAPAAYTATTPTRRKRRRTRSSKNKEELENQRMTHIAVERNRRKQMNEYLAAIRSLMPPSYVQRGDQASIIGGAINFVKELEQLLQTMEAHKRTTQQPEHKSSVSPFAEFFTFPQFSTRATPSQCNSSQSSMTSDHHQPMTAAVESVADIEVTMVETHANIKILSKKRPRQLLKLVAGLQSLSLNVLHLNVSTVDEMALYSISVKVEEVCHLNTVDEFAAAVNQMLRRIQEETAFS